MTVSFDRPGVRINLGSIGKGYAIDRAVDLIRAYWWPTSGLVHGGGSSVYAIGSPPGQLGGRWEIAVRNPFDPDRPLGVIRLRDRALGTSGSAFQHAVIDGQVYGHIIDPRTGSPSRQAPASVTVLAPTAARADALSTAFSLLDLPAIAGYVARHGEIGAVVVDSADGGLTPRVQTFGLSSDDFVAASLEQTITSF
jgi:thiamine biosynthesis lipoprotein